MRDGRWWRRCLAAVLGVGVTTSGCHCVIGYRDAVLAEPACEDGERSEDEAGVDCGGPCAPCADGEGCIIGTDCESRVCSAGTCLPPSCADGVWNGEEADIDCGTGCAPCGPGSPCVSGVECDSQVCTDGLCATATCDDLVTNGVETDTDCGGGTCISCDPGSTCESDEDCESGLCRMSACLDHHVWTTSFAGGGGSRRAEVLAQSSGDIVVLGSFQQSFDAGGGPLTAPCFQPDPQNPQTYCRNDWYLVGLDASGGYIWQRQFVDDNDEHQSSHVGIADGGSTGNFIIAHGTGALDFGAPLADPYPNYDIDIAVAKLSASGSLVWSKRFGDGDNQYGWGITTVLGDVIITGCFTGTLSFGSSSLTAAANNTDVFLAKLSGTNGAHLWSRRFGGTIQQCGHVVTVDAARNVFIAGYFAGTINLGGVPLSSAGNTDYFLAKLTPDGNHLWSKRFGDVQAQASAVIFRGLSERLHIAVDAPGNVIVAGHLNGAVDFGGGLLSGATGHNIFIAKFDIAGTHVWSRVFGVVDTGGTERVIVNSLRVDANGSITLVGDATGEVDFGTGVKPPGGFVLKLAADGSHAWSKSFDRVVLEGVAVTDEGRMFLGGKASEGADVGGPPITPGPAFVSEFLIP